MPTMLTVPLWLASAVALVPPGIFHADEVAALDGQTWLALHTSGNLAALVPTRLAVRAAEDVLVDAPAERSGVEVSSADDADVLMYLRGAPLHARPVELARGSATDDVLSEPGSYRFTFRGAAYRIHTRCDAQPSRIVDRQEQYGCSVVLQAPGTSQVLTQRLGYFEPGSDVMSFSDDGAQRLLFAGDLDGDGKLDLIFDTSRSYNMSRPTLFLSTHATDGAPVGEAAHHESTGC